MSTYTSSFSRYTIAVILILLLVVGSPMAGFVAATELLIRTKVIPNDIFTWHLERFISVSSQNVVFGDSHTAYAVRLTGFQNLSFPQDNVPTMEVKVRSYFSDIRPGKVIIQADHYAFAPGQQKDPPGTTKLFEWKGSRIRLWTFTDAHRSFIGDYWKLFFQGGFANTFTFRPNGGLMREEDFSWQDENLDVRLRQVEKYVTGPGRRPVESPEHTRSARSYHRMLGYLTSLGAEVCMVGMPLPPLLTRSMGDIPEFQGAVAFFESLATQYGARYVDLSRAVPDTSLFLDAEHLNEAGAQEFSPLLRAACFGDPIASPP